MFFFFSMGGIIMCRYFDVLTLFCCSSPLSCFGWKTFKDIVCDEMCLYVSSTNGKPNFNHHCLNFHCIQNATKHKFNIALLFFFVIVFNIYLILYNCSCIPSPHGNISFPFVLFLSLLFYSAFNIEAYMTTPFRLSQKILQMMFYVQRKNMSPQRGYFHFIWQTNNTFYQNFL